MSSIYEEFRNKDPLNSKKARKVSNTSRYSYNCGGYALNCFSWYVPDGFCDSFDWDFWEEALEKNELVLEDLIEDFPYLEKINGPCSPIPEGYYRLGFRIASDGDFHFIKQDSRGRWWHKPGDRPIQRMKKENIEQPWPGWNWDGRYNGPILWMMNKR